MVNPFEFPATLRSEVLGEIVFDCDCNGYVPGHEPNPDRQARGIPNFVIWVPDASQFVATKFVTTEFVSAIDSAWRTLFDRIDDVLRSGVSLIAREIASVASLDEHAAIQIADRLANRNRIELVKLDLSGSRSFGMHELQLCTDELDQEMLVEHDLFLCLGENLEPVSVYMDG